MTPTKEAMEKAIETYERIKDIKFTENYVEAIALALDSSDQAGYRRGVEDAAKVAETITFEVKDKPGKKRIIKPLWGEDTAKAIRNLKETP